jgi:hypothetical protein
MGKALTLVDIGRIAEITQMKFDAYHVVIAIYAYSSITSP